MENKQELKSCPFCGDDLIKQIRTCPICGSKVETRIINGEYYIKECTWCGFEFDIPRITKELSELFIKSKEDIRYMWYIEDAKELLGIESRW